MLHVINNLQGLETTSVMQDNKAKVLRIPDGADPPADRHLFFRKRGTVLI